MENHRKKAGPGQESVWDYPRPPRIEDTSKKIEVKFNGVTIASTKRAKRVLETSLPPVYYIPPDDVKTEHLTQTQRTTYCEWKGHARYFTVEVNGKITENAAWCYPQPTPGFEETKDYLAFYPLKMDECLVDGEKIEPHSSTYYGGWITKDIVGPFKGEPGTEEG